MTRGSLRRDVRHNCWQCDAGSGRPSRSAGSAQDAPARPPKQRKSSLTAAARRSCNAAPVHVENFTELRCPRATGSELKASACVTVARFTDARRLWLAALRASRVEPLCRACDCRRWPDSAQGRRQTTIASYQISARIGRKRPVRCCYNFWCSSWSMRFRGATLRHLH